MIDYRIALDDLHSHHFRVTVTVPQPAAQQVLALPVWIPGSYLVREFARHLSGLTARQGQRPVALTQVDKTTWTADCSGRAALVVSYRVYAFDTSVRAAFLDDRRGFFNATSLCLRLPDRAHQPHRLRLGPLPAGWEVATAMAPADRGGWLAADYDELADHPFELGSFWRGSFTAGGVPHEVVVSGALPRLDGDRLLADARRICAAQIDFWHGAHPGHRRGAAPMARYVFLLNAAEDGFGGLEHRASTALIAPRRDLPSLGTARGEPASDGHVTLLGLISHEYFHTWNVKRLRPAEFTGYDYSRENPTRLLWFFEGFTSYYDELFLLRSGLIDAPRYLRLLAKTVNGVAATPGRRVQSVADASFDAWTKYYRPDENTANATISYYTKGALVALAFDLTLRQHGSSLDVVMRALWRRSGGGPVTEADIAAELATAAGRPLDTELAAWVHGTDDLPLDALLAAFGIEQLAERPGWAAALGLKLSEGALSGVQVKQVLTGSAAAQAGVSAGDELLAVDGWSIRRLDDALAWVARDQPCQLLLVRDQRVRTVALDPAAAAPAATPVVLRLAHKPARAARALRRAWLGA
jgi:predicted metalloprotease with PDZ domain